MLSGYIGRALGICCIGQDGAYIDYLTPALLNHNLCHSMTKKIDGIQVYRKNPVPTLTPKVRKSEKLFVPALLIKMSIFPKASRHFPEMIGYKLCQQVAR
jgi:hypothetical protein